LTRPGIEAFAMMAIAHDPTAEASVSTAPNPAAPQAIACRA
jgi:hypothetical protein